MALSASTMFIPTSALLVEIEGTVCSGKTTLAEKLVEYYAANGKGGKKPIFIRETISDDDVAFTKACVKIVKERELTDGEKRKIESTQLQIMLDRQRAIRDAHVRANCDDNIVILERGSIGNMVFAEVMTDVFKLSSEFVYSYCRALLSYEQSYSHLRVKTARIFLTTDTETSYNWNATRDGGEHYSREYLGTLCGKYDLFSKIRPSLPTLYAKSGTEEAQIEKIVRYLGYMMFATR